MVSSSASAKILIGIPSDPDDSKQLLSWAITILARPNDDIVAIHVLVGEESRKDSLMNKKQFSQIRQAKAHVISVLGEFAGSCQSKQVNLEARVGFSSSIGRGLIEEAKSISAEFLLLRRHSTTRLIPRSNSRAIPRYCFEHAPEGCTVVLIGKCTGQSNYLIHSDSDSARFKGTRQLGSMRSNKSMNLSGRAPSSLQDLIFSETNRQSSSPRTMIDGVARDHLSRSRGESTFRLDNSTLAVAPSKPKPQSNMTSRKPMSPYKFVTALFSSPLRRRKTSLLSHEKQQSLLRCFSYEEISKATKNFDPDNIVGRGGYSEVYRGDLYDGRIVAVKRLAKDNKDEIKEKEFLTELGIIGHVCHPNTANLVGCCIENGLYLIFNFSHNGNLASALHGKTSKSLEWAVRYKIALGVARGLHYLHKCCKHRIIHRDIKASNVLLGPDYEPQITDFGLAKWLPNKWTHHDVIPIEGTFGYLAPEYFMHGIVDEKTDVFAFGVLLLEIITGRRPIDSSKQNLLLWAKPLMEAGKMGELADPKLEGKYDPDQMHRLMLTACYCVRQSTIWRPSMSEVLELLTCGDDSEITRRWRKPNFISGELNDYSMVLGYELPINIAVHDDHDSP